MTHKPNVRLLDSGMVHDGRARVGRTECGIRYVWYGSTAKDWGIPMAVETADPIDCMTCLVKGAS